MTTTAEKIAVMQAFEDGNKIEYFSASLNVWVYTSDPIWDWPACGYRIAATKPSINWDHVSPEYNWLTRDENGASSMHVKKPNMLSSYWCDYGQTGAELFVSYDPGTCDWKDSLVMRPGE